jgi:hypothetical protein
MRKPLAHISTMKNEMNANEIKTGISSLRRAQKTAWSLFYTRLEKVAETTASGEDLSLATAADFEAAGFSASESAALIFILSECGHQTCSNADKWFALN